MIHISVQDLKARLSGAIAQAESGETLVVTRHNQPVAKIVPAAPSHVHRGSRAGRARLAPAIKGGLKGAKGRYLAVLLDDRGDR